MKKKFLIMFAVLISFIYVPVFADNSGNVILNNNSNTTTFEAGNTVESSADIDGIGFIAGNIVNIKSKQDYLFAAGNEVSLTEVTTKDAFVAGNIINVNSSSIRDLYVTGNTITINSEARNINAAGSVITINSKINGDVNLYCENLIIGEKANITGKLTYPEDAEITIGNNSVINQKETYKTTNSKEKEEKSLKETITSIIYRFITMLIITFVIYLLNSKFFESIEEKDKNVKEVIKTSLLGLISMIVIPILLILLMITVVGIAFSIISLLFYTIFIYISIIPTSYYFGNIALKKYINNKYLLITVSLLALYILKSLPIIGGIISFITLIFGFGVYTSYIKNCIKKK